jgi:diacylglycerol O-acyltransferase / wax synthase
MRQLQGMDSAFVALEQRNAPMHIGSILIYDPSTAPGGFVRFKDILSFIEARMSLSRTMRQRLVRVPFDIDYPYWIEDPDFDLEYHVRHVALPKPGDRRQLCIQAARIFSRPLDLARPPWEFTVVEGLDQVEGIPKGCYAFVTKVHHAAIDGVSGVDLLEAVHSLSPDTTPPDIQDDWQPEEVPSAVNLLARGWFNAVTNPLRQIGVVAQAVPGLYRAAKGIVNKDFDLDNATAAPRCRFNSVISPNRVVEGCTFPLEDIKAMRALSPGAKVNDVFLAIIGGAMRKYLESKDDLPSATLTAMAPISVRSDSEKNDMGNQVAAMIAPLGTDIADAAERIVFVHQQTIKSKAMTDAIGARQMTEMSKVSPALFQALGAQLYSRLGLSNYVKPPFSTIVTNVPGPPIPIYSSGAKLVSMFGLVCLTDGMGLGHVVQSYRDQATVTFTACRKMMPDPEFYRHCIQESFDDLMNALAASTGP